MAAHLVAAGELLDTDPERAYAHAEAARRRAARLPVVREAAGEAAYAAGHYDVALNEFRTLRRMSGVNEYLPVMADCERALGRPHAALRLAQEARRVGLGPSAAVEARIVEAGARRDLGQLPEALRVLSTAVAESSRAPVAALARLHYAYADAVHAAGETDQARQEFLAAVELDAESETDAEERLAELDGVSWAIEDDPNDVAD